MAVENTKQLLRKIVAMTQAGYKHSPIDVQLELFHKELYEFFPNISREQLHYELLSNGLFTPEEIIDLQQSLNELVKKNVWRIVQEEYETLKKVWGGIEVPIFIFPITKHRPIIEGIVANKNGVSYGNVIFLFVSNELSSKELRAMIAHEYHHHCRMHVENKKPEDMLLKDSIVIEGMAECIVESRYGKKYCSPWIGIYKREQLKESWKESFLQKLNLKDLENHYPYLYGDGSETLPYWVGYCLGYEIVKSYLENQKRLREIDLLTLSTDEIIIGSDFGKQYSL